MKAMKDKECTCEGRVFPEPPCDVFRSRGAVSTASIEAAWKCQVENRRTGERINISKTYQREFLKNNPGITERFVAANPKEEPPKRTDGFKKVNHLTPKTAGGCPTGAGNLQPHDLLCRVCKKIDDQFTDWQAGTPDKWHQHFRESGASRTRLSGRTPSSWKRN
ncbi:hypothetical protein JQX13_22680 [Archangium violaceum]|uniref:hypothetical protein n=1 Tax=Archangium violaceum TaxID=83451 RepID=UPI00193AF097|nr:hypothetical protein [Archangium violaceum]QRK12585.1 hypothetical protein JQX13_22680 [Archangium violaceum]